jgi:hypothetical protein
MYFDGIVAVLLPELENKGTCEMRVIKIAVCNIFVLYKILEQTL